MSKYNHTYPSELSVKVKLNKQLNCNLQNLLFKYFCKANNNNKVCVYHHNLTIFHIMVISHNFYIIMKIIYYVWICLSY